jgi:DNA-binding transcriptional ArsR family regulator
MSGRRAGSAPATTAATEATAAAAAADPSAAPTGDPFEALGDANRRAIVELLAAAPAEGRSVGDLASALPISRPAVSRHLRLLKTAGLVVEEPRGTRRLYRLHDKGLEAVRAYLERVWGEAAARFRIAAENTAPGGGRRAGDPLDNRRSRRP